MADQKKRISELPESSSTSGLYTLGVNAQNESVKVPLGKILGEIVPVANSAKTAASEAKTAAADAKKNADEAKTASSSALEKAEEAATLAETASNSATDAVQKATARFDDIVVNAVLLDLSTAEEGKIIYVSSKGVFAMQVNGSYYRNWLTADSYMNDTRTSILQDKAYICDTQVYVYDKQTGELISAGVDTEVVKQLVKGAVIPRTFINAHVLLDKYDKMSLETVTTLLDDKGFNTTEWIDFGTVVTFCSPDGWKNYRFVGNDPDNGIGYLLNWVEFGRGNATVGNCYNVTNEQPVSGYYELETAIAATYKAGLSSIGMQITFAIAKNSWKTYQFVGSDVEETSFKNVSNWLDLAGMSAGDEAVINIDYLCGTCTAASFYNLEYAIAALSDLQEQLGITYAKSGLVITYKTGDNKWETKQFKGEASDFGESSLWQDFGGAGGAAVETKDTPEENGKDAFSTGGAFEHLAADIAASYEDNVLKLALVNERGETVGTEKQFVIKGGGGDASGTIVTITPQSSPLYAQAGGSVVLRAAIRSITTQGVTEQSNLIERVELYDRDTNQLLETYRINKDSSPDTETFDFEFDLSSYFTLASQRRFKLIAYDDSEHAGARNINVTAVDVTIKSEQTLNYTASTAVTVGGATKSLPMYRFPNNASDKGILCTVEIQIEGEWKVLGTATVSDTYSHSISINPNNCCGKVLKHGAYALRIHGEDIASGVMGNFLHTAVMVVDISNTTPIVVSRWLSEKKNAEVKQYETINLDFAAYTPAQSAIEVSVIDADSSEKKQSVTAQRGKTYTYTQRVADVATDGSVTINLAVVTESIKSQTADFKVLGSLLDIEAVTAQLMFDIDMQGRSNSDADKSIKNNGYELKVRGANYTTNGFIKDSFGTSEYNTETDKGVMSLRIAENVTASLNYQPFNVAAIETNGLAIQFRIRTKHIADDSARLISCITNGFGFYVTGKKVIFTTDNAESVPHTIEASLKDDTLTDVAIVIEPTSQAPYAGIGCAKMYFDGELIGTSYYEAGSLSRHNAEITFDGSLGDLYLYNIRAWETFYSFEQSFDNYLLKMSDTDSMIREYTKNQVMASQSAEGKPATNRPQAQALYNMGIPYFVLCKNKDTADLADNYPEYLETLDGDKKTKRTLDVYAYFPDRPWQDFKAIGAVVTNQGTTSSMRPIKNVKMKFKEAEVTLLHERSYFSGEQLAKFDECAANAAKHRVQPIEGSVPTNIITVKVDYSESGGANNGASATMYNDLQRALGASYMTPAQRAYTGKYNLNTSIDSTPIAFFRTDVYSSDATSPSYGYFHAKGNWNDDKGDAAVFGFENCEGYNNGCLNYGDFYELIAARNQTLEAFAAEQKQDEWIFYKDEEKTKPFNVVVLSEFCGEKHKIYRKQEDGSWLETTGTMQFTGGRWRITGDVVNPVENYELRAYDSLDWFQGVNTVDDMLVPDSKGKPIWLTYFESRYPDDDTLNAAYSDGRKVPYRLFKWLEWCQQCNHNLDSSDGNITLDGKTVAGTKANRLLKFKHELHEVANVYSMLCYHIFTDYMAAVDQRSKNMMIGFYLEEDGQNRMYLNHLYDGDTILESDNDCGKTIPAELDPNNDPNGYYQGHDSVLFCQIANSDFICLTKYTSDSDTSDTTKTITTAAVCDTMRRVTLKSGLKLFSPQGIEKYWITDRLDKWAKLVSSYDGIRKYIEHSTDKNNYFYALHGLSIQRLQDYVETRFRYRDGFYRAGTDIYSSAISMRCTGTNMSVKITAAKDGFFGIGVDQTMTMRESVYLKAGESATLKSGNTNLASGVMLYVYGADRIGELDIRNATPKQLGFDISALTLLKKLVIGGSSYTPATKTGNELDTLNLGQMPFVEEIDIRNTTVKTVDATYCPRIKKILSSGSALTSITLAETSPISTLELPATMQNLSFVNLPNLTYPNGGLTVAGFKNVKRFQLSGCAGINSFELLQNTINGGAKLADIDLRDIDVTADTKLLDAMLASGTKGVGTDLDHGCDGITGRWILSSLIDDDALKTYKDYFVSLELHNAQFTTIVFDDTVDDPKNITNLENNTTGSEYEATGHILRIREKLIPVKGKLNTSTKVWEGEVMSNGNYQQLKDGTAFDYRDTAGQDFDVMMRIPRCWYKGVNDFKNQKKYIIWSSLENTPISTAKSIIRKKNKEILFKESSSVITTNVVVGTSTLDTATVLTDQANYNVYKLNVKGMKQVRWAGINNTAIGAVFVDAQGIIVGKFNMAVSHTLFDFVEGDYIFTDVPATAESFYFASKSTNAELEAIAVDSTNIEAIEPDWVLNEECLGGVYQASVDGLTQLRSISGANVRVGTNTSKTSTEWQYDKDGNPTNTPLGSMNYTCLDLKNLAARRGEGYQLFDYEMSKFIAILYYSLIGNRDAQLLCGYGRSAGGSTGYADSIGNTSTYNGQMSGNKCLGFESFFGCTWEFMDNVAENVPTYEKAKADHYVDNISSYPIDAIWHIYDPVHKTERTVQGITTNVNCIARTKHGRFCDVIASKCSSDTSVCAKNYCDGQWYSASRCRVVRRSHSSSNASGGLAYANSDYAFSNSYSNSGSRLAFRGTIKLTNE